MNTKILVNEWFNIWEQGNFEALPLAEDFTHTSPYGVIEGKNAYMDLINANRDKFLGHHFEIYDTIYKEDSACIRYTAVQGDFRLEVSEWHYIKNGLIQSIVAYYNIPGEIREDRKLENL